MNHLPRIVRYLRPYWPLAVASAALVVLAALVGLAVPWPLQVLIDHVLGTVPFGGWTAQWIEPLGLTRSSLLALVVVAGLLLTVAENGLAVLTNYVNTRLEQRMILDFRSDLFQHAQRLSLAFHDEHQTGYFMACINYQSSAIGVIALMFPPLAQSIVTLVGMFWIALNIDSTLTWLSLTVVPFLYYSVNYYTRHIESRIRAVRTMEGQSLSIVHEAMAMLRVIVAFGRESYEHRRFREQGVTAVDARVILTTQQTLFSLAVQTTMAAGTALVLGVGAKHVLDGQLTVGHLLVIMAYIAGVYQPLQAISSTLGTMKEQIVNLKMSIELLEAEPEVRESTGAVTVDRSAGHVVFENVSFAYKGRTDTLAGISFEAKAGEAIAIVGPTGAGKSTLVSLLPRFVDPGAGRILLDGVDIRQITLESLRRQISIVLQEPLLFSGSIEENIRYGRLDATTAEIEEAARAADAHDFIMGLPQGYQTPLGERGSRISVGERQRIAVARAFVKDAPILILDEPTSSIDSKTEQSILAALDRLMAGRTTFIIAHRLSTIRNVDRTLVLDHGTIVAAGTHAELGAQPGLYRQLYQAQAGLDRADDGAEHVPEVAIRR